MAWLQNLGGPGSSCFSKHVGATCKTDSHFQPRTMELVTFVALTSLTGIFCPYYTFSPLLRARSGRCSRPRTQGPSPLVPVAQSSGTRTTLCPR